ncbi:MAG: TonB-dependent receptor [Rikenellaceae bacterium]
MKKLFTFFAALLCSNIALAESADSLKVVSMREVTVSSVRASATTPTAHSQVDKSVIERANYGQDMPFLLSMTPSVVATSDAGNGIGYTSLRVRGTDASRINITTNGVPLNDSESHAVYWVNVPDLASSLQDIQIQRGVGSSTNGAGAFGASIDMSTARLSAEPSASFDLSVGSYNTSRQSAAFSTGLLNGHWVVSGRLSQTHSDGYIDRATTDLNSYMLQAGYYNGGTMIKFMTFGGSEQTYHAWNGVDAWLMDGNRTYNSCGEIKDADSEVIDFYDNQIDKYNQTHYHLTLSQRLSPKWNLDATLHYTDGFGYYEEYKNSQSLQEYSLSTSYSDKSNLIRRKQMDNGFGGLVASVSYDDKKMHLVIGGAANRYVGDHYGNVIWVQNYTDALEEDHEYYRNKGVKDDVNIYAKLNYSLTSALSLYADMQARYIGYTIDGENDKWDWTTEAQQTLAVDEQYYFANPKAGLNYQISDNSRAYASFAMASREPTRNNFTDAKSTQSPRPETLYDYEAGYTYSSSCFSAGANFYYMNYKDQLILTGELNEIGELLADNVEKSYRMGVELTAAVKIARNFTWSANATFSRNKIQDYTAYVDSYDADWNYIDQQADELGQVNISYSPNITAASLFEYTKGRFYAALQSNYVGEQYLANSNDEELLLDSYFVSNLRFSYNFSIPNFAKSITVGASLNNIFGVEYSSNGYSWSCYEDGVKANYIWYVPQATRNFMLNLSMKF